MAVLFDFVPLLIFLGIFVYTKDLLLGVIALMIVMPISFLVKWRMTGKFDKMLFWSIVFLLAFGGISLALDDPLFIKWKPTVFYWAAAVVFLASQYLGKKTIAQRIFENVGDMPDDKWPLLNLAWVVFLAIAGVLNLYVVYNFSELFWANFKVFGLTGITFVFIIAQTFWMIQYIEDDEQD